MTSSVLDAPPARLLGDQRPRIESVPPCSSSAGLEAIDLAADAGLKLDPWQAHVLQQSLGERADHKWAAFEVGLICSRQNGKGSLLEARELAGLFLFGEELILHSAHEFKTAADAFRRIARLIQDSPRLDRRVARIRTANGAEMIELKTGQRLRFVARSAGSGRGFAADTIILDEAYNLGDQEMAALLPTLSSRPNPQVWYTSTAGDLTSVQLGRVRRRGVAGTDPSLAFFEWSVDAEAYDAASPADWARANPGMGIRITAEYIGRERAALSPDAFARERLGVGDYPADEAGWPVIPESAWQALCDPASAIPAAAPVSFAADATPSQSHGSIAAAAFRADGRLHAEVVDHRRDTAWIPARLAELAARWGARTVVIDPKREASVHIAEAEKLGLTVLQPNARQMAQACGHLYVAACDTRSLVHLGQAPLDFALSRAVKRELAGSWAFDAPVGVDLSPLVAVTLAAWAASAGTQQFFGSWR